MISRISMTLLKQWVINEDSTDLGCWRCSCWAGGLFYTQHLLKCGRRGAQSDPYYPVIQSFDHLKSPSRDITSRHDRKHYPHDVLVHGYTSSCFKAIHQLTDTLPPETLVEFRTST